MKYSKVLKQSPVLLLLFAAVAVKPVWAVEEPLRIGAISSERILRDSAPAKAAQVKLEQEFSKRDKELQEAAQKVKAAAEKLDKDAAVMAEPDRVKAQRELADLDREYQRRQREFREDLNARRNEELAQVLDRANKVIRQLAEQKKFDLIVQEGVYVSPRIDMTDEVIRTLNNGK